MTLPSSTPQHDPDWRKQPPYLKSHHFEFMFEIAAVIVSVVIGRSLFPGDASYWTNVYMTLVGVLITVLVLDRRAERRDRLREERELKAQLVRDAGSTFNEMAKNAVHQLRKHGWLEGNEGLLVGANLEGANLQGVNLSGVNLEKTNFAGANLQLANLRGDNLQMAQLWEANLQGANLEAADLYGADLGGSDLQDINLGWANLNMADLRNVNLRGASLERADLKGANLYGANLRGANLVGANLETIYVDVRYFLAPFDESSILPDGICWTPHTDLTKFTKPKAEARSDRYTESQGN